MALSMQKWVIIGHVATTTSKSAFWSQNLTILAMVNEFPLKNPKFCETWKNLSFWQKMAFFQKLSFSS